MWSPYEVFKVEPKTFTDLFKEFLINSVFVTPEAVQCMQAIKAKCNDLQEMEFFSLVVP